jgi:hypothetical protein
MSDVRDDSDKPIKVGARIHVNERPALCGTEPLPGFGGIVTEATPDCVTLREFGTYHIRNVRPRHVSVQFGETRDSLEYHAAELELARTSS